MELNPEDQQNLMGLRLETPGKWLSVLQPTACVRQPSNFVNGDRNHATTAIQGLWMMDVAGQNQRPADPDAWSIIALNSKRASSGFNTPPLSLLIGKARLGTSIVP